MMNFTTVSLFSSRDCVVRNMSPGSTLTLPRSVARHNKRHSLHNPSNLGSSIQNSDSRQSDSNHKPPDILPKNDRPCTPPSSYSTPQKQTPGKCLDSTGQSPHSDNSVDNDIYYEALEYPVVEGSSKNGHIPVQGFIRFPISPEMLDKPGVLAY